VRSNRDANATDDNAATCSFDIRPCTTSTDGDAANSTKNKHNLTNEKASSANTNNSNNIAHIGCDDCRKSVLPASPRSHNRGYGRLDEQRHDLAHNGF